MWGLTQAESSLHLFWKRKDQYYKELRTFKDLKQYLIYVTKARIVLKLYSRDVYGFY
jgi:hypothetical protein